MQMNEPEAPMPDGPPVIPQHSPATALEQELDNLRHKLSEAYNMVALGRLVTGVVHEINNPIGSIVSNNEVSLRALDSLRQKLSASRNTGEPPPQKALDLVDTLISLASVDRIACERISAVVRSLKTYSRTDDDEAGVVRIGDLIRDAVKLIDCQFRRRIQVKVELGDLPEIEAFPQLLSQVFLNILVNAGQAIEGEGVITVRTSRRGSDEVEISITDSGKGIPDEYKDKIFQAGFTTKPLGVGTGLGLALSRRIVEQSHGGRIWFESAQGKGTTFFLTLPVRRTPEAAS